MKKTVTSFVFIRWYLLCKYQLLISLFFASILLPTSFHAQDKAKLDSLEIALKSVSEDTSKLNYLQELSFLYQYSSATKGLEYARQGLALAQKKELPFYQAKFYGVLGQNYHKLGSYDKAIESQNKSLELYIKLKDAKGESNVYSSLGLIYNDQGEYEKAIKVNLKALTIREKIGDKELISTSLNNIGAVYFNLDEYEKTLDYLQQSLKIDQERGDKKGISKMLNNIGAVYQNQGNYTKALENFTHSLIIKQEIGDSLGIASTLGGIGNNFLYREDYKKALHYRNKALQIYSNLQNKKGLMNTLSSISEIYFEQGLLDKSIQYSDSALTIAKEIGSMQGVNDAYLQLAITNEAKFDYKKAYLYHQLYTNTKDSLLNSENLKQISEVQTIYETDKKEKQIEIQHLEITSKTALLKQKQVVIYASITGIVLLMVLAGFIFYSYRLKQKANIIISLQKKEVEIKNEEIENQKNLLEIKNKDITDSINYARKIQEAILPSKELKRQLFPDAFVLFMPKDIVSGDFYWFSEKNGKRIIAAVDCTGHGVPGAFMSMIGNAFLNEIVNENGITKPSEILNLLRYKVIFTLQQANQESESRDGMDIALLSIDDQTNTAEFAGANNPLWIVRPIRHSMLGTESDNEIAGQARNDGYEVLELKPDKIPYQVWNDSNSEPLQITYPDHSGAIKTNFELISFKGDKQPIGTYFKEPTPFTNHTIKIQQGDSLYILTDGYADQFGGEKGKKFRYKQLQETLLSMQKLPMQQQETRLINSFEHWKGSLEQVDDVLVIGIKI